MAALVVLTPDVREVRHASPGFASLHGLPELAPGTSTSVFSDHLPQALVAHLVSNVARNRPHSFEYLVRGTDGVERCIASRVVVPFGGGRPVVFGVWDAGVPVVRPPVVGYEAMAAVLDTFRGEIPLRSLLDTLLLCVAQATAADAVRLEASEGGDVRVLASVALAPGDHDVADRAAHAPAADAAPATALASDESFRLLARGPRRDRGLGWLGERTFRTARELLDELDPEGAARDGERPPATVVYVDDDTPSRELLTEFFRLLPHLDLVAVATVDEARAAIVAHRPAVVIADAWQGPESTEAFVTELVDSSLLDAPAVVVLSADANPSTIARFRRLGVASYLSKPIHLDRLAAVVTDLANSVCPDEGNGSSARTNAASGN